MGKALLIAREDGTAQGGGGNNRFAPGSSTSYAANRADASSTYQSSYFGKAGQILDFTSKWDNASTGRTMLLRQNTTGTTSVTLDTITLVDGTSGVFSGSAEPLSIAAGTLLYENFGVSGATAVIVYWARLVWQATGKHSTIYTAHGSNGPGAHDQTFYQALGGHPNNNASNATEANARRIIRAPGVLSNLQATIGSANANDYATTIAVRINNADGAGAVSAPAATTGKFLDTTDTDTVASGDLANLRVTGGVGTTGTTPIATASVVFENQTDNSNDLFAGSIAGANASSTTGTQYCGIAGTGTFSTDETLATIQHGFAVRITSLRCTILTNSWTVAGTATIRVNAADGIGAVSIGSLLTGTFEDITGHADYIGPTDDVCLKVVAAGTTGKNANFRGVAVTETDAELGVGSSAGVGTATGVGASIAAGVGSSAGSSAPAGIGAAILTGGGAATGAGTATGVGATTVAGVGSSAGTSTATGLGALAIAGVGSSNGTGAATGVGSLLLPGVGASAGVAVVTGIGAPAMVGSAAGHGVATGVITAVFKGVGVSAGRADVSGVLYDAEPALKAQRIYMLGRHVN